VVVGWDIPKVVPKTIKISKINESGIVMLLPNMPFLKLLYETLKLKE